MLSDNCQHEATTVVVARNVGHRGVQKKLAPIRTFCYGESRVIWHFQRMERACQANIHMVYQCQGYGKSGGEMH
jgi:hypothetical protein